MSSNFIGSKIAIVTKSQSRYSGTIIGIDAQSSSIVLGNVKCYGTENRLGSISNGPLAGSVVPIMQFNNSDIEDLKIVDEEGATDASQNKNSTTTTTTSAPSIEKSSSIHDDPAIVSAVISSSTKENSGTTNRLIDGLHKLHLGDDSKKEVDSRARDQGLDLGGSWSLLASTKEVNPKSKSKFFDNFALNSTSDVVQSLSRPQRWTSSNSHATQTSYRSHQNGDEKVLPTRQPFFSEEQTFFPQQRNFNQNRRPMMNRRRPMNGGNRETFDSYGNQFDDEFDFESNNRKFNKITSDEEFEQIKTSIENHQQTAYDKKKSFFDNITLQENGDLSVPVYHRSKNQETFGNNHHNDRFQQRSKFRPNGNRRSNYNNSQNGYSYRY